MRPQCFFGEIESMKNKKTFLIFVILGFSIWGIINLSARPEYTRKPSADWGRGLPIGTDASGSVGMVVEEDGSAIHVVWPFEADDDITGIRYVQLGQNAQIDVDKEVVKIRGQMRSPHLFMAANGHLHLLWAVRVDATQKWQLWYVQIDQEGNSDGEPIQISETGTGVFRYAVATTSDGDIWTVWDEINSGGINLTGISAFGEKRAEITRVTDKGSHPDIAIDADGKIHLTWVDNDNHLRYALSEISSKLSFSATDMLYISLGTGASLDGPVLGMSDEAVYVFWSILNQSGLEAGTARTEYISFPQESPEEISYHADIGVLPLEEQPFSIATGSYSYSELVPASYISSNATRFVYAPVVTLNPADEMSIAVAAQQLNRKDEFIQIAVAIMEDGEYKGYTIATKTQEISSAPVLAADVEGDFHLIWQEGFTKEDVYYTTTDAETRAILDRPTLRDASTLILAGGMESLAGILLFPLAFPWIFPGLVIVVAWRMIKNDENISFRSSQILLIISILLYQGSKILVFPTVVSYIPFSAWVDISAIWATPLQFATPILVLGIAIALSEYLRRRSKEIPSTLRYYFIIVLVDMILTLAIYGVNFLGAF
jgi:hypothetical protein